VTNFTVQYQAKRQRVGQTILQSSRTCQLSNYILEFNWFSRHSTEVFNCENWSGYIFFLRNNNPSRFCNEYTSQWLGKYAIRIQTFAVAGATCLRNNQWQSTKLRIIATNEWVSRIRKPDLFVYTSENKKQNIVYLKKHLNKQN